MEMREWLFIIVIAAIVLILLDGFRRKRKERNKVRMKLEKKLPEPLPDEEEEWNSELPNGGARSIPRRGAPPDIREIRQKLSENGKSRIKEIRASGKHPHLAASAAVPVLMDSVELPPESLQTSPGQCASMQASPDTSFPPPREEASPVYIHPRQESEQEEDATMTDAEILETGYGSRQVPPPMASSRRRHDDDYDDDDDDLDDYDDEDEDIDDDDDAEVFEDEDIVPYEDDEEDEDTFRRPYRRPAYDDDDDDYDDEDEDEDDYEDEDDLDEYEDDDFDDDEDDGYRFKQGQGGQRIEPTFGAAAEPYQEEVMAEESFKAGERIAHTRGAQAELPFDDTPILGEKTAKAAASKAMGAASAVKAGLSSVFSRKRASQQIEDDGSDGDDNIVLSEQAAHVDHTGDEDDPLFSTAPASRSPGPAPRHVPNPLPAVDEVKTKSPEPAPPPEPAAAPEEVIIINVMARPGELFQGSDLLPVLLDQDMRLGHMSIFHRHAERQSQGPVMFSMANMVKPGTFSMSGMADFTTPGVCFFLQLPSRLDHMESFNAMLKAATAVRDALGGELKDENRSVFTRQTIEHCRQRISDFELKQLSKKQSL